MSDKNHDQFIDNLLHASLARYSGVTPRSGLESRVLANVRASQERRPWVVWVRWLAVGGAAAVLAVGVLKLVHRLAIPAPPLAVEVSKAGATVGNGLRPSTPPTERVHASRRRPVQPAIRVPEERATDEPRLAVFPSPRPLTQQEELILQYARATPASVLSAFSSSSAAIPDLEIKALDTTPLDSEETEIKNNQ